MLGLFPNIFKILGKYLKFLVLKFLHFLFQSFTSQKIYSLLDLFKIDLILSIPLT